MDLLGHSDWWITSPGRGICPSCVRAAAVLEGDEALRRARSMKSPQAQALAARIAGPSHAQKRR
jgi:hypothetical protein